MLQIRARFGQGEQPAGAFQRVQNVPFKRAPHIARNPFVGRRAKHIANIKAGRGSIINQVLDPAHAHGSAFRSVQRDAQANGHHVDQHLKPGDVQVLEMRVLIAFADIKKPVGGGLGNIKHRRHVRARPLERKYK